MKKLSSILLFCTLILTAWSQGEIVDVTKVLADSKTQQFNDGKHTVNGYVYAMLEQKTSCCGNDAIYLEIKFNESGYVTSAKTLTGKNECFKKSVLDIVKNIRWDATGVKGEKAIYFEVKPVIPCSGSANENTYAAVEIHNNPNFGSGSTSSEPIASVEEPVEEPKEEPKEEPVVVEEPKEEPVEEPVVTEPVEEPVAVEEKKEEPMDPEPIVDDEFSSGPVENPEEGDPVVEEEPMAKEEPKAQPEEKKADDGGFLSEKPTKEQPKEEYHSDFDMNYDNDEPQAKNNNGWGNNKSDGQASTQKKQGDPNIQIPPQADKPYTPKDYPNASGQEHEGSHVNMNPSQVEKVDFADADNMIAVYIKKQLRAQKVCGLAQALAEVMVSPDGNVMRQYVMKANTDQVAALLPDILMGIKFKPRTDVKYPYKVYVQFKTDIICEGEDRKPVDLDNVEDYLEFPAEANAGN